MNSTGNILLNSISSLFENSTDIKMGRKPKGMPYAKDWEEWDVQLPVSFIISYYVVMPCAVVGGLLGNSLCFYVLYKRFARNVGFAFQLIICLSDSFALIAIAYYTWGYYWNLYNLQLGRGAITAFWFELSWLRRTLLMSFFDPLRHFFVSLSPFLLLGASVDRLISIAAPTYYKERMNRALSLIIMVAVSVAVLTPNLVVGLVNQVAHPRMTNTSEGPVVVYTRESRPGLNKNQTRTVTAVSGVARLVACGLLVVIALITYWLFRKQQTNVLPTIGSGNQGMVAHNQEEAKKNQKLLIKLMLVQACLSALATLPELMIRFAPKFSMGTMGVVIHCRDAGYALQTSLNVYLYAAVSRRFRRELWKVLRCKKQQGGQQGAIELRAVDNISDAHDSSPISKFNTVAPPQNDIDEANMHPLVPSEPKAAWAEVKSPYQPLSGGSSAAPSPDDNPAGRILTTGHH